MKKEIQLIKLSCLLLAVCLFFMACNNTGKEQDNKKSAENSDIKISDSTTSASATLSGTVKDTTLTGTVDFTQEKGKVKMKLMLSVPKMANKSVAVHIHEMGDCGDMGKMAHGHWNPTHQQHGKWGSASFHSGDIGNVTLDSTGRGTMEMETDLWSIGGSDSTNLLNRSIIVHSGVDDFTSQPAGNAGSRIGCGIISKK